MMSSPSDALGGRKGTNNKHETPGKSDGDGAAVDGESKSKTGDAVDRTTILGDDDNSSKSTAVDNNDANDADVDKQLLIRKLVVLLKSVAFKESDLEDSITKIFGYVGVADMDDFAVIAAADRFDAAGHTVAKPSFTNKFLFCTAYARYGSNMMKATSIHEIIKHCTDAENGTATAKQSTSTADKDDQSMVVKLAGQKLSKTFSGNDEDWPEWKKVLKEDLVKLSFDCYLTDKHLCAP